MTTQNYRDTIVEAINHLNRAQSTMFTAMVNVGMAGQFKELKFEVGDEVIFELESFEDSGDKNLDVLIALIREMEKTKMSLMNLNAINDDELDEISPDV